MHLRHIILLSAALCGLCVSAETSSRTTVGTTTDLLAQSDEAVAKSLSFNLTGTVLYVDRIGSQKSAFVLDDGGSGAYIHGTTGQIRTGDVVHIKGYTLLSDYGERIYALTTAEKVDAVLPPEALAAPIDFAANRTFDYKRIRVRARVRDIFVDELDSAYVYCILGDGERFAYAVCRSREITRQKMSELVGAEVEITGVCLPGVVGRRRFMGSTLRFEGADAIRLITPAIINPYELPQLESYSYVSPQHVREMGRRQARGNVLATWNGDSLMLATPDRQLHVVTLKKGQSLPACGNTVTVGGNAETDFYLINLSQATCLVEKNSTDVANADMLIRPTDILKREGKDQINAEYYGRIVKIKGTVTSPNSVIYDSRYLYLDCGTHIIPVNISSLTNFSPPPRNSIVEATGVCLMDVANWRSDNPAPTIRGFSVVARKASDISVVACPPFWTPLRALAVMGATSVLLLGFIVWNVLLKRQVRKRSAELRSSQLNEERAEIKTEERTRLAVELHDSLSQNLAGIACQLSATADALSRCPEILPECLATAQRMLDSSRTELKQCLFDLRGDALETEDFETAIRKTLFPYLEQAEILTELQVHRAQLDESLAHATLCIIRELVANAIRHGKAERILITGSLDGNRLSFSVSDNGTGFEPASRPGAAEGHFGLDGIGERVERYDGTISLESSFGNGTKVRVTLTIPPTPDESPLI